MFLSSVALQMFRLEYSILTINFYWYFCGLRTCLPALVKTGASSFSSSSLARLWSFISNTSSTSPSSSTSPLSHFLICSWGFCGQLEGGQYKNAALMMEVMAWVMKEKRKAKQMAGHEVTILSNQSALPSKAILLDVQLQLFVLNFLRSRLCSARPYLDSRPTLWFFSCGFHLDFLLHPSHMSH